MSAIADPDPRALERAAALVPGAAALTDADELVERDDVDAVVVTTPPATHADLAVRILAAGKHLYLEKPVATTRDEADRLAALGPESGLVIAVGFNRRFHPVVLEAARLLDSARSTVVRVDSSFEEPLADAALPGWKRARATGGGALLDLASHHVDLVRHLLGVSLTPVAVELASIRSEHDDCTLRFDGDGCEVEIRSSFVRGRCDVLELHDRAGRTLRLDRWAGTLSVGGRRVRSPTLLAARSWAILRPLADRSYAPSLRDWVARIHGEGTGSPAAMADGLASLEAILAAEALATPAVT